MTDVAQISLGGDSYEIKRSRLGKYLDLLTQRDRLDEAVESGDNGKIASGLYEYLRISLPDLDRATFESAPWFEVIQTFAEVASVNLIPLADQYAILSVADGDEKDDVPWDYHGRAGIVWKHILAYAYKWSLEDIDNLWPEQAVRFMMEILFEDITNKEFTHQLSEIAYEYDSTTKKSNYRPLRRPAWMVTGSEISQEKKKKGILTQIRRDFLPAGVVIGPGPTSEN